MKLEILYTGTKGNYCIKIRIDVQTFTFNCTPKTLKDVKWWYRMLRVAFINAGISPNKINTKLKRAKYYVTRRPASKRTRKSSKSKKSITKS